MNLDSITHWERGDVWLIEGGKDIQVEYWCVGDPADPVLIFVHGWGMSATSYRRPINALAEDGWYVIAPTLPGFGDSTPIHGKKNIISCIAGRFVAVISELGIEGAHPVVAHSLGCGVAAEMAILGDGLAQSLTLICPIGAAGNAATSWAQMAVGLRKEISRDTAARIGDALPNVIRHPVAVAASGFAAKRADMIKEFTEIARDTPVHIVLADGDGIIAKDKLPHLYDKEGILVTTIHGTHGWMLTSPRDVPSLIDATQMEVIARRSRAV